MSSGPNLEALRKTEAQAPRAPRKPVLPRLMIAVLVLGALAVLYAVLEPVLFPPRTVQLSSVRVVGGDVSMSRSATYVEAAGWLEADPFPITVRPLVTGVVERLDVLEGQAVVKDETVIGVLRNLDVENEKERAKAQLDVRTAEEAEAKARLDVAASLLEQKLDLRANVATLAGQLAAARKNVETRNAHAAEADAAEERAWVDLRAQEELELAGSVTPLAKDRASARVKEAAARAKEMRSRKAEAEADVARLEALLEIAEEGLRDPRDLAGDVAVRRAEHARAIAAREEAQVVLRTVQRLVDALTVTSPVDGIVLRLESAPGALVGPQGDFREGEGSGTGSTGSLNRLTGTLVSLYDPSRLAARVDVLLPDVRGIGAGTKVEIKVDAVGDRAFRGVVDRLVHEADLNKNTLQVKVRIEEPDPLLRPEMLCRARFEVKNDGAERPAGDRPSVVLVRTAAIRDGAVFVYDPTEGGKARRVPVRTIREDGEWTEVEARLGLSSKVILDVVRDGEAVRKP